MMESSIWEAVFLPWWKGLIYMVSLVLSVIAVKVTITFDLSDWLKERKKAKELSERKRVVSKCAHIWTVYSVSPYSRCDRCMALASTTLLLNAKHFEHKPVISGYAQIFMKPGANEIFTDDYLGAGRELFQ